MLYWLGNLFGIIEFPRFIFVVESLSGKKDCWCDAKKSIFCRLTEDWEVIGISFDLWTNPRKQDLADEENWSTF